MGTANRLGGENHQMLNAFIWTFIGALIFILGGWLKKNPPEDFSGRKALETLVIALIVALVSIAFNIPPAEAMTLLNQWTADLLQLATSTGLIALFEFWYKTICRRIQPQPVSQVQQTSKTL
jgi:hypothetical protein